MAIVLVYSIIIIMTVNFFFSLSVVSERLWQCNGQVEDSIDIFFLPNSRFRAYGSLPSQTTSDRELVSVLEVIQSSPGFELAVYHSTNSTMSGVVERVNVIYLLLFQLYHLVFAHSLMSRVIYSPNSIVTAMVNSGAYHQSVLMDKKESMLYVQK